MSGGTWPPFLEEQQVLLAIVIISAVMQNIFLTVTQDIIYYFPNHKLIFIHRSLKQHS